MKVELCNFFLRPLHEEHSCLAKTASLITAFALTILTGGLYLIPLLIAQLTGSRKVTVEAGERATLVTEVAQSIRVAAPGENHRAVLEAIQNPFGDPTIVAGEIAIPVTKVAKSVRFAAPVYQRRNYGAVIQSQLGNPTVDKVALIKMKQASHLVKLQALADGDDWASLQQHTMHPDSGFDWWMFPVDRPSASWGDLYAIDANDVDGLKADAAFMESYRAGVILVAKSWGWDLENNEDVTDPVQRWTGYNVRLGKMLQSLTIFGQADLHERLVAFVDAHQLRPSLNDWILPYLQ